MSKEKRNTIKKTVTMHPKVVDKVRFFADLETEVQIAKEAGLKHKKYKAIVWFRYVANGQQEDDFDTFYTEALTVEHAKMKIEQDNFPNKTAIPYKWEVNQIN